jgi:hypothetical protein
VDRGAKFSQLYVTRRTLHHARLRGGLLRIKLTAKVRYRPIADISVPPASDLDLPQVSASRESVI